MAAEPLARVIIRRAASPDADRLAQLGRSTFRDTYQAFNTPQDLAAHLDRQFGPGRQAAELADPDMRYLLAELDDHPVGFSHLIRRPVPLEGQPPGAVEVHRFYVIRQWHGRGLAQRLMARTLEEAVAWGAPLVWLGVWQENPRAIAFYRKSGFEVAGTTEYVLGDDRQTDWVMVHPGLAVGHHPD